MINGIHLKHLKIVTALKLKGLENIGIGTVLCGSELCIAERDRDELNNKSKFTWYIVNFLKKLHKLGVCRMSAI
jgi:hypothetical protein